MTVFTIDIEKTGDRGKINAMGACLMRMNLYTGEHEVLFKKRYCFPTVFPDDYEPRCVEEVWEKGKLVEKSSRRPLELIRFTFNGGAMYDAKTYVYLDGDKTDYAELRDSETEVIYPQREQRLNYESDAAAHGMTRAAVWRSFLDDYIHCENVVAPGEYDDMYIHYKPAFHVASDNPTFDIPHANSEIKQHLEENGIEYRRVKQPNGDRVKLVYSTVRSLDDIARGVALNCHTTDAFLQTRIGCIKDLSNIRSRKRKHGISVTDEDEEEKTAVAAVYSNAAKRQRTDIDGFLSIANKQWADPRDISGFDETKCPF